MAKLNLQQQPRSRGYLECLVARPGHKIVQMDFAALEPKVMAYYSRDPGLMNVYGPKEFSCLSVNAVTERLDELGIRWEIKEEELIIHE